MQQKRREKLRFIVRSLKDMDLRHSSMAYNTMKQNKNIQSNENLTIVELKKKEFIKKLTNQGTRYQYMAVNSLKEFLIIEKLKSSSIKQYKEKVISRIMNKSQRQMSSAMRVIVLHTKEESRKEIGKFSKLRGICNRIQSSNTKFLSKGWNNLLESYKQNKNHVKKFGQMLLDSNYRLQSQGFKQLRSHANFSSNDKSNKLKISEMYLKRMVSSSLRLKGMALRQFRKFLADYKSTGKQKLKVINMISNSTVRLMAASWRNIRSHTKQGTFDDERIRLEKKLAMMYVFKCLRQKKYGFVVYCYRTFKENGLRENIAKKGQDTGNAELSAVLTKLGNMMKKVRYWGYSQLVDHRKDLIQKELKLIENKAIIERVMRRVCNEGLCNMGTCLRMLKLVGAINHQEKLKQEEHDIKTKRYIEKILRRVCNGGLRRMGQCFRMLKAGGNINHNEIERKKDKMKGVLNR